MKRERFLIAVLWLSALMLLAMWFFNTIYGFNLFIAAHWQYLAELQLMGTVERGFYISFMTFIVIAVFGLYVLIVPWHRKIKMQKHETLVANHESLQENNDARPASKASPPDMSRPPRLNINVFTPAPPPVVNSTPQIRAPEPRLPSPEDIEKIRNIVDQVGFTIKQAPRIGDVKLDLWAIGPDEALVIGIYSPEDGEIIAAEGGDSIWKANGRNFKSPVWRMTSVVQRLEALFLEILDPDLKINILPFVISKGKIANKDAVQVVWDALGVKMFDDVDVFDNFMHENRPGMMDEVQKGNFDAFSEFVDTVTGYFGGGK